MFGCKEEELAWLGRDSEEKCGSSLDVRGPFGPDGDTMSSGEGLSDPNRTSSIPFARRKALRPTATSMPHLAEREPGSVVGFPYSILTLCSVT